MKQETKALIEEIMMKVGDKAFKQADIKGVSWSTFKKYVEINHVDEVKYEEVDIEDIVSLLNSCAGDDCYNCDWEYKVIDGKPYEVIRTHKMYIKGWKE